MAKKGPRAEGWPGGHEKGGRAAIKRIAEAYAEDKVPEADHDRYWRRLTRMMGEWEEFELARIDVHRLQRALHDLPSERLEAFFNPKGSPSRARKARRQLLARVFDPEQAILLGMAANAAAERAGSPDDFGALGLALASFREVFTRSRPIESNAAAVILLALGIEELHRLSQALQELEAAGKQDGADAPADPAELARKHREAMTSHPVIGRSMRRRILMLSHRLVMYVRNGIVRAHLNAEELAPLLAWAQQLPMAAEPQEGQAAPTSSPQQREQELVERLEAFAADPANDGAFRRFVADLAAEAQEAAAANHPVAEKLDDLVALCGDGEQISRPLRSIICQASLERLLSDMQSGPAEPPDA